MSPSQFDYSVLHSFAIFFIIIMYSKLNFPEKLHFINGEENALNYSPMQKGQYAVRQQPEFYIIMYS